MGSLDSQARRLVEHFETTFGDFDGDWPVHPDHPVWSVEAQGAPVAIHLAKHSPDWLSWMEPDWYGWGLLDPQSGESVASIFVKSESCSKSSADWPFWFTLDAEEHPLCHVALLNGSLPRFLPSWHGWSFPGYKGYPLAFMAVIYRPQYLEEFGPSWTGWTGITMNGFCLAQEWLGHCRRLPGDAQFKGWFLPTGSGTIAHYAASHYALPEMPEAWPGWFLCDEEGQTVAHLAADTGCLPAFSNQWKGWAMRAPAIHKTRAPGEERTVMCAHKAHLKRQLDRQGRET